MSATAALRAKQMGPRVDGRVSVAVGQVPSLLIAGLGAALSSDPGIEVLGLGLEPDALIALLLTRTVQVVVLDEVAATRAFLEALRDAWQWTSTIVLARRANGRLPDRFRRHGVAASAPFDVNPEELRRLVVDVARHVPKTLGAPNTSPLATLTRRQRQVLEAKGRGSNAKEIAAELGITPSTVATHLKNAKARGSE